MHLFVATRGTLWDTQRWAMHMQAKMLPHKFKNKLTGEVFDYDRGSVEIALRPLMFWEIIFPAPSRDIVLTSLWPAFNKVPGTETHFGNICTAKYQKILPILRRCIGKDVKPLPTDFNRDKFIPMYKDNIEFFGIGLKEDAVIDGFEML